MIDVRGLFHEVDGALEGEPEPEIGPFAIFGDPGEEIERDSV